MAQMNRKEDNDLDAPAAVTDNTPPLPEHHSYISV
jgi:hypothetical protein